MEWTEVNIYTTTEGIELVCSKLTDIGVKGFAIRDAEDFKEFLGHKPIEVLAGALLGILIAMLFPLPA